MSKKLIEEKNDLIEQAQAIVDKAKVEERAMTEEEAAQFEELKAKVNAIAKTIGYEEDLNEMDEKTIKNDMTHSRQQRKPPQMRLEHLRTIFAA